MKMARSGQVVRVVMTHLVAQANSLAASDDARE
jgi:hypothetical protein